MLFGELIGLLLGLILTVVSIGDDSPLVADVGWGALRLRARVRVAASQPDRLAGWRAGVVGRRGIGGQGRGWFGVSDPAEVADEERASAGSRLATEESREAE